MKQDDGVTDRSVNQSRTTEGTSERVAHQVKVQEKFQTNLLFDAGSEAHMIPNYVWEQFGEQLTLPTTRVTLRGANGQDRAAMGELLVRGTIEKFKVQFTAVIARDARRCRLSGAQSDGINVQVEATREFPQRTRKAAQE